MYIVRNVTKGQIVDDDPPSDAIELDPDSFVKYVVEHLDEAF